MCIKEKWLVLGCQINSAKFNGSLAKAVLFENTEVTVNNYKAFTGELWFNKVFNTDYQYLVFTGDSQGIL